jgi:hypothetical protein
MRSLKFPKIFNLNSTNVWKSSEYLAATKQNTELLLQTERGELFGDPYFGLMFKHYLYSQNSFILKDIIIDIIYTQLALFIPQLHVNRQDIDIIQDKEKGRLYCNFSAVNQIDYQVNTFNLILFDNASVA